MEDILFIHCHLIVDEKKEYLDGAILLNERIVEVFPTSYSLDICDRVIDLKGQIVMPGFFNTHPLNEDDKGILYSFKDEYQEIDNELIENVRAVSLDPFNSKELIDEYHHKGIKVFIGQSNCSFKDIKDYQYDGYSRLFYKNRGFECHDLSLINGAFIEDKYVEINSKDVDETVLYFVYKNIKRDRLILIGDIYDGVKKLHKYHVSACELLALSSLNAQRLYGFINKRGNLVKGKEAKLLIMDDDFNIKAYYLNGELKYV